MKKHLTLSPHRIVFVLCYRHMEESLSVITQDSMTVREIGEFCIFFVLVLPFVILALSFRLGCNDDVGGVGVAKSREQQPELYSNRLLHARSVNNVN